MWLLVTTLLSFASGWGRLSAQFPDRNDETLRAFGWASGYLGPVMRMNGTLTLTVCRNGLRVDVSRLFGPFDRPFFVPWSELQVRRLGGWLGGRTRLGFGRTEVGYLEIGTNLEIQLARAAGDLWPDASEG